MPTDPFAPVHLHTIWKRPELPDLDPNLFEDNPDYDNILFGRETEDDIAMSPGLMVAFLCMVAFASFFIGVIIVGLVLLFREVLPVTFKDTQPWTLEKINSAMPVAPHYNGGDVILYQGDCRLLPPFIPTDAIGLLFTDPPYGMDLNVNYNGQGRQAVNKSNPETWGNIEGDSKPFDPSHLLRFEKKILFGANWYADKLPTSGGWIVWDKIDGLESKRSQTDRLGFNDNGDAELAWTNLGGACRIVRHRWAGLLKASERDQKRVHPTQKPVAMLMKLIAAYSKPGDILDPYAGSGSLAVAARRMGRVAVLMELKDEYCEVIAKRLQQQALGLFDEEDD